MSGEIAARKRSARNIVKRISSGESVATSLAHVSEVANILEAAMPLEGSHQIMRDLIHSPTISIFEPTKQNYIDAVEVAEEAGVGLNDAVAYLLMQQNGIDEIYSYDQHFGQLKDVKSIQE